MSVVSRPATRSRGLGICPKTLNIPETPLSKECVLVLHTFPQHIASASSPVTLLMSSFYCPPNTMLLWYVLLLMLQYCCQHCICTATPSPLLLLQLQHLQLKSIQNVEWTMISIMHLPPESLTVASIYTVIEESALLLTLHCANCTVGNSALCQLHCFQLCTTLTNVWLLLVFTTVTLASHYVHYHWSILLLNIVGPFSKVLIHEVESSRILPIHSALRLQHQVTPPHS